jgi:hypothetical protein
MGFRSNSTLRHARLKSADIKLWVANHARYAWLQTQPARIRVRPGCNTRTSQAFFLKVGTESQTVTIWTYGETTSLRGCAQRNALRKAMEYSTQLKYHLISLTAAIRSVAAAGRAYRRVVSKSAWPAYSITVRGSMRFRSQVVMQVRRICGLRSHHTHAHPSLPRCSSDTSRTRFPPSAPDVSSSSATSHLDSPSLQEQ